MNKASSIQSSASIGLFLLSIAWFKRIQRKNEKDPDDFDEEYRDSISPRAVAALKKGSSYWESFLRVLQVSASF